MYGSIAIEMPCEKCNKDTVSYDAELFDNITRLINDIHVFGDMLGMHFICDDCYNLLPGAVSPRAPEIVLEREIEDPNESLRAQGELAHPTGWMQLIGRGVVALVGPQGAGKSMLAKHLTRELAKEPAHDSRSCELHGCDHRNIVYSNVTADYAGSAAEPFYELMNTFNKAEWFPDDLLRRVAIIDDIHTSFDEDMLRLLPDLRQAIVCAPTIDHIDKELHEKFAAVVNCWLPHPSTGVVHGLIRTTESGGDIHYVWHTKEE